jgi:hypothetical protein
MQQPRIRWCNLHSWPAIIFFTITVTDRKGNPMTVTVDLRLTNISPQN